MSDETLFPPRTEEALADLVRAFAAQGRAIRAVGNGTKAHVGPACGRGLLPQTAGKSGPEGPSHPVTVSLRGLDRITQYEPGDLVVTVQTGVKLEDLQAELGKRGQWLAIDPPYADATIGGILATNSSGPRRLAYGTARDMLLGLRVVEADGTVTKSGGRVVKNVTGFDLPKLHIGAFGTLGIITEASFKVRPRPPVSAVIVIPFASFEAAHAALLRVHASSLRPAALEALDQGPAAVLRERVGAFGGAPLPEGTVLAIVGVEGTRAVVQRHARDLPRIVMGMPASAPVHVHAPLREDATAAVWAALRDLPERLKSFVRVRVGAKPHDLPGVMGGIEDRVAGKWARVGSGLAWLDCEPSSDLPDRISALHAKAAAVGGYAVVESAPLDLPGRDRLPWGTGGHPLMRAIKQAWDPAGGMGPGRIGI